MTIILLTGCLILTALIAINLARLWPNIKQDAVIAACAILGLLAALVDSLPMVDASRNGDPAEEVLRG